jgi:hypothetical protein
MNRGYIDHVCICCSARQTLLPRYLGRLIGIKYGFIPLDHDKN